MKKLNPFQLPQVHIEPQSSSTSETNPSCGEPAVEKSMMDEVVHVVETREDVDDVMQPCPSNPDLFNIVLTEQQQNVDLNRPRQYGRRSNPVGISPFAIETSNNGAAVRDEKTRYDYGLKISLNRSSVSLPTITNKRGGL